MEFDKLIQSMRFRLSELVVLALLGCSTLPAPAQTPADAIALEQQQKWADAAQAWKSVTVRNPSDAAAFASLGLDLQHLPIFAVALTS